MLDWIKIGAEALLGAALCSTIAYWQGEAAGRSAEQASARTRALELIERRSKDNVEISTMDVAGLWAELGGRWVPDEDRCD